MSCHVMLVMLCYVSYVMLCYVMLCYVMLCYVSCVRYVCYVFNPTPNVIIIILYSVFLTSFLTNVMLVIFVLCYFMLVMLCYVMLCYVMLCYVFLVKGAINRYSIYPFVSSSIENYKINQKQNFQLFLPMRFHF